VKFTFTPFSEVGESDWEALVTQAELSLNYEVYFIKYELLSYQLINRSGVVYLENKPMAMYVTYLDKCTDQISSHSLSPVYLTAELDEITEINNFYLEQFNVGRSINDSLLSVIGITSWLPGNNSKLPQENDFLGQSELVIELTETEEVLWSRLSRNHKRTIRTSVAMGQNVICLDVNSPQGNIEEHFQEYKNLHISVSGRQTRPDESFEYMKELIFMGTSKLFVSVHHKSAVSFLYCDSSREFSRGWSQVTKTGLDKGIFPRTLLEWTAIKTFKNEGKAIYHLGSVRSLPRSSFMEKLGFDEFKRRFGPTVLAQM